MTLIVPAVLGGVAIAVMALVSLSAARRRKNEPAQRRVDLPRILVHDINDDRCTGCDACVAVCPTNVLDLVDNKSRVLRFQDCIQCEACMWACPTQALVMHPEGTQPQPLKMPELDEAYQTMVPGQYLIGEVAGKPLVKNGANLGRGVVEHMLANGLRPGAQSRNRFAEGSDANDVSCVDVAIVGSGPGGLSAALTCIQRGLSYVVLEKDNTIASTIAHYPKGKLIMAEPYECENLSLLPVFDTNKEEILPIWREIIAQTGMQVKLGEAVESVKRNDGGTFDVRTTVASYRAQRVVLSTGTRGKPRTLRVQGENLPKVQSLLDDPDDYRGQAVLVVGGGDSACEAALALADAGAKVIMSYRGRSFHRAQAKNKTALESYVAQRRIKVKYDSVVEEFAADTVTLVMHDGTRKRYPNTAAFVLIGSDPPVKWLAKLGIRFVERPHQYALPQSDELVRRFVSDAIPCPENAAGSIALTLGTSVPSQILRSASASGATDRRELTGARKWLRSATNMLKSNPQKDLDGPIPLAEFARRGRRRHTGRGRRDGLMPRERTRVLRMLRDEGARLADEESHVYRIGSNSSVTMGTPEPGFMQDSPPPEPPATLRQSAVPASRLAEQDSAPRQAVIVGLARAMAETPTPRRKRASSSPPPTTVGRPKRRSAPPPTPSRARRRSSGPPQFLEAPTVQIDTHQALQGLLRQSCKGASDFDDEATRAVDFDPEELMGQVEALESMHRGDVLSSSNSDSATGAIDINSGLFLPVEDHRGHEAATYALDLNNLADLEAMTSRAASTQSDFSQEDPTRAIDLSAVARESTLSDIDWDLD